MNEVMHIAVIFAAAALGVSFIFWIIQRRNEKPLPFWASLIIEAAIGVVAGVAAYHVTHDGEPAAKENLFREFGTFLIHTLFVMIVIELGRSAHKIEQMEHTLQTSLETLATGYSKMCQLVDADERIILARAEPIQDRREISVIGVERLEHGELPAPLRPPDTSAGSQWEETISVLRFDRLQDLLFSTDYLRHFFELSRSTKNQYRLLIVNDRPRSEVAIRSFLEMSDRLEIPTYVHMKGHFYAMLSRLDAILSAKDASEVQLILQGQPELSILFDRNQGGAFKEDNYLLRYRVDLGRGPVKSYGLNQGQHKSIERINMVHKILLLGVGDDDRKGLQHLAAILKNNRDDPWSKEALERALKP